MVKKAFRITNFATFAVLAMRAQNKFIDTKTGLAFFIDGKGQRLEYLCKDQGQQQDLTNAGFVIGKEIYWA